MTARMAAFIPGASPPDVRTAIRVIALLQSVQWLRASSDRQDQSTSSLRMSGRPADFREVLLEGANGDVQLRQCQSHSGFPQQLPVFRQSSQSKAARESVRTSCGDSLAGIAIALLVEQTPSCHRTNSGRWSGNQEAKP